jgi:hypothetical protein
LPINPGAATLATHYFWGMDEKISSSWEFERFRKSHAVLKDLANRGVRFDVGLARPMVRSPCSIEGVV